MKKIADQPGGATANATETQRFDVLACTFAGPLPGVDETKGVEFNKYLLEQAREHFKLKNEAKATELKPKKKSPVLDRLHRLMGPDTSLDAAQIHTYLKHNGVVLHNPPEQPGTGVPRIAGESSANSVSLVELAHAAQRDSSLFANCGYSSEHHLKKKVINAGAASQLTSAGTSVQSVSCGTELSGRGDHKAVHGIKTVQRMMI